MLKILLYVSSNCISYSYFVSTLCISHMLLSLDNEEFYEQQKPLQLGDLRILIIILKEVCLSLFP